MAEKISRIIFHVLTLVLLNCAYLLFVGKGYRETACIFCLAIIINPFVTDKISKKLGGEKSDYWYALRMLLIFLGILVAMIIAILSYSLINLSSNDANLEEFRSIFKISVYIIYLIIMFFWKNSNKSLRYMIFGLFYLLCIILSFCTDTLHSYVMGILNHLPNGNLDIKSYDILINDCFIPIKEAMLTYIIFDTAFDQKTYNQNEKIVDKILKDEEESLNKSSVLDKTEANSFKVNVLDNENGQDTNYQIRVNRK